MKSEDFVDPDDLDHDAAKTLFIDGTRSIGGKINDAATIGEGIAKRRPNLMVLNMFDPWTKNPMLVLYATQPIRKGDELLYSYGVAYWRTMWKAMMHEHTKFIEQTEAYIKYLKDSGDLSDCDLVAESEIDEDDSSDDA